MLLEQSCAMSFEEYRSTPGLSNSGMKHLAVSPLRFWFHEINPNRPIEEPSHEMQFGTAVHCAVLEPEVFDDRYATPLSAADSKDCLVTADDLRTFLREAGRTPKGTKKAELIAQVQEVSRDIPILEVLEREYAELHRGKIFLRHDDWWRARRAADALHNEAEVRDILSDGRAEVAMFANDIITGVHLKARMDWVRPSLTFDIKTFSQKRGKSIDESIADALYYEGYLRQAWFYTYMRGILRHGSPEFVFAFVESEPPFEVRIKKLRPRGPAVDNLYWSSARIQAQGLIGLYADCMKRFGERPWREPREIEVLEDEHIRQLAY